MINSAHAGDGLPIIVALLVLIGGGFPDDGFITGCENSNWLLLVAHAEDVVRARVARVQFAVACPS